MYLCVGSNLAWVLPGPSCFSQAVRRATFVNTFLKEVPREENVKTQWNPQKFIRQSKRAAAGTVEIQVFRLAHSSRDPFSLLHCTLSLAPGLLAMTELTGNVFRMALSMELCVQAVARCLDAY